MEHKKDPEFVWVRLFALAVIVCLASLAFRLHTDAIRIDDLEARIAAMESPDEGANAEAVGSIKP